MILAVLFLTFTQTGDEIAADLFRRAHGAITDQLRLVLENPGGWTP